MNILEKIQTNIKKHEIESIIIESPYNRRYATGFTGTFGVAFITKDKAKFITDFRYTEQATNQAVHFDIVENRNTTEEIAKLVNELGIKTVGFEEEHVSFKQYSQLKEKLNATLVPVSNLVEGLRQIKSEEEINKIKIAANIADKAFSNILNDLRPGVTEMEINNKMEMYMREAGATSSSFDLIIASGHRSAMPHGVASTKEIETGDMVTLDFGALYEGYCSDMTRTVAVGEPNSQLKEIYEIVKEALNLGTKAIKSGVSCELVDSVVRDYISSKGYGEYFGHGTGHSFGLEIHEHPYFAQKSTDVLKAGMVMTIEPGIYLPNIGGVRIEDDILVTNNGFEVLTSSQRDLIVL